MSLPCSMADFVLYDRLLQKAYSKKYNNNTIVNQAIMLLPICTSTTFHYHIKYLQHFVIS